MHEQLKLLQLSLLVSYLIWQRVGSAVSFGKPAPLIDFGVPLPLWGEDNKENDEVSLFYFF